MTQGSSTRLIEACIARGKKEIFSQVVTVTPEIAQYLIDRNDGNRSLRTTKIAQYAADIRGGAWALNGEPIIVSDHGQLNDGQHRCLAVIEANKPIDVLMVFGLPRETRLTIDQGANRSASDYAGMEEIPNAAVAAAIARMVEAYDRSDRKNLSQAKFVTNADVLTRIWIDEDIAASASFASTQARYTKRFVGPASLGFCHYVFSKIDSAAAEAFMLQVCRGEGLKLRDPAWAVRERLLNMGKASRDAKTHIIFRGWNAYREGRQLTLVKIVGDQSLPALL